MNNQTDVLKIDKNMTIESVDESGLAWLDPKQKPFKIVGFNWLDKDQVYRRLRLDPDPVLPPNVELLSNHTAGGQIKFKSNSRRIAIKVTLPDRSTMDHMPNTGNSGFDLYVGEPTKETLCGVSRLDIDEKEYSYEFSKFEESEFREITLNFPLYNGVNELSIGIEQNAEIAAPTPFVDERPIVIYGTSIAQGGCASRPGMCYSNILSRKLNRPFINLGFSGSAKGEPEVAEHVSRIDDPAMFVLDYEANVFPEQMKETLPGFIDTLRGKHPETPILVVSKVAYAREVVDKKLKSQREITKEIEIENVERCRAEGDNNIYFVDAEFFQGEDFWECTVDGVHPNDLGFYRMAENLLPEIEKRLT